MSQGSRPLRVVHLVPHLNYGGVQEVVRSLALEQKARGHDVSVLCWEYPGDHPEAENILIRAGVSVQAARNESDHRLASLRTLRSRLGSAKIDILHIHNPFEYCFYGGVAARLRRGTKVVISLHATAMFDRFGKKHRMFFVLGALLAHRIVSVCDEIRDVARDRFRISRRKLAVVENGIDVAPYLQLPLRTRGERVIFGSVGRISKVKNQPLLVEAFALAYQRNSSIGLHFLGGGVDEVPALRELAVERGVGDHVDFSPFSADVAGFLSEIDVFVLPSRSEGLPLSLVEAIAAGLPVIATDVGGVRKVIETTQSGWVCASNDPQSMMEAMIASLSDEKGSQRAERARSIVSQQYVVERMTDDYERIYMALASRTRPPQGTAR